MNDKLANYRKEFHDNVWDLGFSREVEQGRMEFCYFPKKPEVKTYPNLQVVDHFLALTKKRKERKIKAHLSSVPVVNYP